MEVPSVTHATFVIERSFPTTPDRVFAAFADPAKKRRWFAEDESRQAEVYEMDFRVGGRDRSSFRLGEGPYKGTVCTNDTVYEDIEANRRIILAYTMTLGDRRISASLATFEFLPTPKGTDLVFTEQGAFFPNSDGPQMREEGWRKLLDQLAKELTAVLVS